MDYDDILGLSPPESYFCMIRQSLGLVTWRHLVIDVLFRVLSLKSDSDKAQLVSFVSEMNDDDPKRLVLLVGTGLNTRAPTVSQSVSQSVDTSFLLDPRSTCNDV